MAQQLLTAHDLSSETGIPVRTLDQWAWLKTGPQFVKLGRRRLYRREDVDAWISSNLQPTASATRR